MNITVRNSIITWSTKSPTPPYMSESTSEDSPFNKEVWVDFEFICFEKSKTQIQSSSQSVKCNDAAFGCDYASPNVSSVTKTSTIREGYKVFGKAIINNILREIIAYEAKVCSEYPNLMISGIECDYKFEVHEEERDNIPVLKNIIENHSFECMPTGQIHETTDGVNP